MLAAEQDAGGAVQLRCCCVGPGLDPCIEPSLYHFPFWGLSLSVWSKPVSPYAASPVH